jgi:hypothetical protein
LAFIGQLIAFLLGSRLLAWLFLPQVAPEKLTADEVRIKVVPEPDEATRPDQEIPEETIQRFVEGELATVEAEMKKVVNVDTSGVRGMFYLLFMSKWTRAIQETPPPIYNHVSVQNALQEMTVRLLTIAEEKLDPDEYRKFIKKQAYDVLESSGLYPDGFAQPILEAAGMLRDEAPVSEPVDK